MVLEELIRPSSAKKRPASVFVMSFIISSISIWIFYHVFPSSSSVLPLAFLTIGFVPLFHRVFFVEIRKEEEAPGWAPGFIARHFDLFEIYLFLFLGLIASYTFWFVVLPQNHLICSQDPSSISCLFPTREKVFAEQITTYNAINPDNPLNSKITGKAIAFNECRDPQTRSLQACAIYIFNNNFWVLLLAFVFSFLYGAGAIFLIGWNASVIATVIGAEIVFDTLNAGIERFIGIIPHGSFEITGYFIGAIAGGIISAAITTKKYSEHAFEVILKDTIILFGLAILFLVLGAILEAATIINPAQAEQFFVAEIILVAIIVGIVFFKKK